MWVQITAGGEGQVQPPEGGRGRVQGGVSLPLRSPVKPDPMLQGGHLSLPAPSPYPPLLPRLHLPPLSSAHLRNVACRAPLNWPPLLATPVLPPLLCPPHPHPPPPLTCGTLRASCSPCGPPEQTRTQSRRGERTARAHLHNVCVCGGGRGGRITLPGRRTASLWPTQSRLGERTARAHLGGGGKAVGGSYNPPRLPSLPPSSRIPSEEALLACVPRHTRMSSLQ